jgi:hypothetical protein
MGRIRPLGPVGDRLFPLQQGKGPSDIETQSIIDALKWSLVAQARFGTSPRALFDISYRIG